MSKARNALHARRAALVARSAAQRDDMVRRLAAFRQPLVWADRGLRLLRAARRHETMLKLGLGVGLATMLFTRSSGRVFRIAQSVGTLIAGLRKWPAPPG